MAPSSKLVVLLAAWLSLPCPKQPAVTNQDPQPKPRFAFELPIAAASRPAMPEVRVRLRWDAARARLLRECGGLDADANTQLWMLAAKERARVAKESKGAAAVVLEPDPAVASTDLLAVLREAPDGLQVLVAGAGTWLRGAAGPETAPARPAAPPVVPGLGRDVAVDTFHSPTGGPCAATEAREACRDPAHWILAMRGKNLNQMADLVERLTWEAAQDRGPADGPGAPATHRVLLRDRDGAPFAVFLRLADACVQTGFRRLEILAR